jgi:hypothetical protein
MPPIQTSSCRELSRALRAALSLVSRSRSRSLALSLSRSRSLTCVCACVRVLVAGVRAQMLTDFMAKIDTDVIGTKYSSGDNGVDNRTLNAVNEAIRSHPVEIVHPHPQPTPKPKPKPKPNTHTLTRRIPSPLHPSPLTPPPLTH